MCNKNTCFISKVPLDAPCIQIKKIVSSTVSTILMAQSISAITTSSPLTENSYLSKRCRPTLASTALSGSSRMNTSASEYTALKRRECYKQGASHIAGTITIYLASPSLALCPPLRDTPRSPTSVWSPSLSSSRSLQVKITQDSLTG